MSRRKKTSSEILRKEERKSLKVNQVIGQEKIIEHSQPVYDSSLMRIADKLIGVRVMVEAPIAKGVYDNRPGIITEVYPHHCLVRYRSGDHTMTSSINFADLYHNKIIDVKTGYPEVNKNVIRAFV